MVLKTGESMSEILNKEDFKKFLAEEMTVSENRKYELKVNERFDEIGKSIASAYNYNYGYIEYADENPFDGKIDGDFLEIHENSFLRVKDSSLPFLKKNDCKAFLQFPLHWFYTDYKQELLEQVASDFESVIKKEKEIELAKESSQQKLKSYKDDIEAARKQIEELVPEHLLKYICFVTPENLEHNVVLQEREKKSLREKKIRKLKSHGMDVGKSYDQYKKDGGSSSFNDWLDTL